MVSRRGWFSAIIDLSVAELFTPRRVALASAVACGVIGATPGDACACTPPPPFREVLTLALDSVQLAGVGLPTDSYRGFDVTVAAEGYRMLFLAARDTQFDFRVDYTRLNP